MALGDILALRWIAAAVALALSGCSDDDQVAFRSDTELPEQSRAAEVIDGIARDGLFLELAHRGTRRIDVWGWGEVPTRLAFRERITTDGQGKFSVEPIESLTPGMTDWDAFDLLQRVREGFIFRYRDFAVRDPELFERNWRWTKIAGEERIAGRRCERVRVERRRAPQVAYEVSFDPETGAVMRYEEFDVEGRSVCALEYETFELAPDLSGAIWHQPSNEERPLDLGRELGNQVEAAVLRPRLLPPGYELRDAATLEDGQGQRWLKLSYQDGVEPLFFLQALPGASTSLRSETTAAPAAAEPDTIAVYQMGRASVLQGTVRGERVMVVGKVPEAELLDLVESSLP